VKLLMVPPYDPLGFAKECCVLSRQAVRAAGLPTPEDWESLMWVWLFRWAGMPI